MSEVVDKVARKMIAAAKKWHSENIISSAPAPYEVHARAAIAAVIEEMMEIDNALVDKALVPTSAFLDLPGSRLQVNREKFRIRLRAMLAQFAREAGVEMGER